MPTRKPLKMKLPPRPSQVLVVIAGPEMISRKNGAVLFVAPEVAAEFGLVSGEERNILSHARVASDGAGVLYTGSVILAKDVGRG